MNTATRSLLFALCLVVGGCATAGTSHPSLALHAPVATASSGSTTSASTASEARQAAMMDVVHERGPSGRLDPMGMGIPTPQPARDPSPMLSIPTPQPPIPQPPDPRGGSVVGRGAARW